jgi:hypothetical protein
LHEFLAQQIHLAQAVQILICVELYLPFFSHLYGTTLNHIDNFTMYLHHEPGSKEDKMKEKLLPWMIIKW